MGSNHENSTMLLIIQQDFCKHVDSFAITLPVTMLLQDLEITPGHTTFLPNSSCSTCCI